MSGLKLDHIEKLLVESELERGVMRCVFRCPASGFEVRSSARVVAGEGLRENAEAGVPTGGALMESLARAVTTAFGSAFFGAAVLAGFAPPVRMSVTLTRVKD